MPRAKVRVMLSTRRTPADVFKGTVGKDDPDSLLRAGLSRPGSTR